MPHGYPLEKIQSFAADFDLISTSSIKLSTEKITTSKSFSEPKKVVYPSMNQYGFVTDTDVFFKNVNSMAPLKKTESFFQ